jgi:hypothetical protein
LAVQVLSASKTGDEEQDGGEDDNSDYVLREDDADESAAKAAEAKAAADAVHSGSLFEIKLLLNDSGESLDYDPPPSDYMDRVGDVLANFVASLCSLTRLFGDDALMEAVLGDKADEVERGAELQDLVTNEDYDELVRMALETEKGLVF